jgi:hypothetical protein
MCFPSTEFKANVVSPATYGNMAGVMAQYHPYLTATGWNPSVNAPGES